MTLPSWPFAFLYVWLRLAGVGMRRGEEEQKGLIWEAGPTVPLSPLLLILQDKQ